MDKHHLDMLTADGCSWTCACDGVVRLTRPREGTTSLTRQGEAKDAARRAGAEYRAHVEEAGDTFYTPRALARSLDT